MGGTMSYQRMRSRNGLMHRKPDDDPDPYWRGELARELTGAKPSAWTLVGDLNRMERDYLKEDDPAGGLSGQVARATGVRDDHVRRVLRYVFFEQS